MVDCRLNYRLDVEVGKRVPLDIFESKETRMCKCGSRIASGRQGTRMLAIDAIAYIIMAWKALVQKMFEGVVQRVVFMII
jgi:hypothetical protein